MKPATSPVRPSTSTAALSCNESPPRVYAGESRGGRSPLLPNICNESPPRVYAGESRGGRSPLLPMNFDFTDRDEAFRKEVRGWLEANLPDDLRGRAFAASRAGRDEVRELPA